jgi:arginyl-tRNA synthetase
MTGEKIKKNLTSLVKKTLPELPTNFILEWLPPPQPEMGDLCLPCFKIGQELKQSPEKIAQQIEKLLNKKIPLINLVEQVKSQGPYLNVFLDKPLWMEIIFQEILKSKKEWGRTNFNKQKRILIEYSAPNTNKPQHLGHLRNNFLGWTMAQLFSATGAKTTKINLINDRGIHICQSMLAYQKWGEGKTPESEKIKGDAFVGQYYVLFNQKAKDNPALLEEAQAMLQQWEQGDPEIITLWQKMNQWAIEGFKKTYQKIGVDFDVWYFESDIYEWGKKTINKALKKGLCYKREDGAIEIDLEKYNLGKKVLLRPDGTSVYITQDIGLAQLKQEQFNPHLSVYVVCSEQDYHFKVLFKVLEIFDFDWVKNLHHLSYNLVFLPHGRMKSRQGQTADADEVIQEMENMAKGEILSRNPNLSPLEVSQRAEIITQAALKFYCLKFTPEQKIKFDPQVSISFEGDSGPYCQYTYVRIQSILKKVGKQEQLKKIDYQVLKNKLEIELTQLLFNYPEIIKKSTINYNPSYLAHYLLSLAQKFNEFYHHSPVLKAEPKIKEARLVLIQAVATTLKKGLALLGIEVLEEM